jgi:hypothetical protein
MGLHSTCRRCGAEMEWYDGGEARNYEADDLLACAGCGHVEEVELLYPAELPPLPFEVAPFTFITERTKITMPDGEQGVMIPGATYRLRDGGVSVSFTIKLPDGSE